MQPGVRLSEFVLQQLTLWKYLSCVYVRLCEWLCGEDKQIFVELIKTKKTAENVWEMVKEIRQ